MSSKATVGALLVVLFLSACSRPDTAAETAPTPAQTQAVDTVRAVRTVTAERGPLTATRTASVTVEPLQESRVAAGTGGRVERILKREGETVAAGEAVIALDDAALRLQVQNAQLAVESARINLDKAQRSSGETGAQATQQLNSAQTSFDIAQRQFTEGQALFEAGGVSATDLSSLEAQLAQARAALTGAQDAVARSGRSGSEDLALLRVSVNQAQTSLAQAQDALNEAQVKAPFAGEVAEVLVEEGEFIPAGGSAFRLVSVERQLGRFFGAAARREQVAGARPDLFSLRRARLRGPRGAQQHLAGRLTSGRHHRRDLPVRNPYPGGQRGAGELHGRVGGGLPSPVGRAYDRRGQHLRLRRRR